MGDPGTRRRASPDAERPVSVALRGREAELDLIAALFDEADDDSPTAVVIRGDAGQGKTALLDEAAAAARDRGVEVLRATGVEFERGLAFSGLTAVLRPLLDRLDELTTVQAEALRGALGLAPARATASRPTERPSRCCRSAPMPRRSWSRSTTPTGSTRRASRRSSSPPTGAGRTASGSCSPSVRGIRARSTRPASPRPSSGASTARPPSRCSPTRTSPPRLPPSAGASPAATPSPSWRGYGG